MKRLIPIGIVLGVLVIAGAICTSSVNSTLDQSSHTLDSMALLKSMDVMNNQVGVIDKLVNVLTIQNLAIGIFALFVLFITFMIVRGMNSKAQAVPQVIVQQSPEASYPPLPGGMPRYIAFGPAGINYIRRLPRGTQEDVLDELYNITAEVERMLGRSRESTAMVVRDKSGKVIRWGG